MAALFSNFRSGAITDSPLSNVATTVTSSQFATLPVVASPDTMWMVLDPESLNGTPEIVQITAHTASATTVTVVRGQQTSSGGYAARSHTSGTRWVVAWTAADGDATRDASNLSSGTIASARLSGAYTGITGLGTIVGTLTAGTFSGSGASLTGIPATSLTGTIDTARLTGAYTGITGVGTLASLTVTATITGSVSGNAATATTLATARTINGVSFNGSANITVAADANTLTGTTLASGVTASSLTSIGTITNSPSFISSGKIDASPVTGLQILNNTASNDAFMTFHVSGDFAGYFGIGGAENDLVVGGFSYGAVRRRIFHSGNTSGLDVSWNQLTSTKYIGTGASGYGISGGSGPVLLSDAGTNWIHFNYDGSLRIYVDSTLVKTFVIDHPDDNGKYLVHACAEGPTADVFYRGEGQTVNGQCWIELPGYFESLTEAHGRTVMVTPITEHMVDPGTCANLGASAVVGGRFKVSVVGGSMNPSQRFFWRVDAVRKGTDFAVEPEKASTVVAGEGPYTYVVRP